MEAFLRPNIQERSIKMEVNGFSNGHKSKDR